MMIHVAHFRILLMPLLKKNFYFIHHPFRNPLPPSHHPPVVLLPHPLEERGGRNEDRVATPWVSRPLRRNEA